MGKHRFKLTEIGSAGFSELEILRILTNERMNDLSIESPIYKRLRKIASHLDAAIATGRLYVTEFKPVK